MFKASSVKAFMLLMNNETTDVARWFLCKQNLALLQEKFQAKDFLRIISTFTWDDRLKETSFAFELIKKVAEKKLNILFLNPKPDERSKLFDMFRHQEHLEKLQSLFNPMLPMAEPKHARGPMRI